MMRILPTVIPADAGESQVAGHDLPTSRAVRAVIGVTGQFSAVDNLLTGAENLRLMADPRGLGRDKRPPTSARAARRFVDLADAADNHAADLFGGDAPPP